MEKEKNTKDKILEEALKLFSQYGYAGTSMSDISSQLNLTKQALYKHYSSKQEIMDCLLAKMNEEDCERAKNYNMPEGNILEGNMTKDNTLNSDMSNSNMEKIIEDYRQKDIDSIKQYTMAQFLHWTQEEFASRFRKLLTIEQYRDEKMAKLYQYYLADGPVSHMEEIFKGLTNDTLNARQIAMDFYGPIFLLYSIYDEAIDKQSVLKQLNDHVVRFAKQLEKEIH